MKLLWKGIGLVAVFVLALYLASLSRESETVRDIVLRFGYIGVFLVSLLSGFNLAVPIPAVAFLPLFLESGLSIWPTLIVVAFGMTLADLLAFYVGHFGRQAIEEHTKKNALKLRRMRERFGVHPLAALFFFICLVPLPNEILLVPLGLLGYRVGHVLPVIFLGNTFFTFFYALGMLRLFSFFS